MSCDCYETTTTVSPQPPVVSAGVKISQLTSASSLAYNDLFVYVDVSSQQTKNVTFENVIKSINSSFVVDVDTSGTYLRTSGSWVEFDPNTKLDTSAFYPMSAIDHTVIQNIGVYSHSAIDVHIDDLNIHFPMSAINGLNPIGGTSGQVLTKNTSGAYDYSWKTPIVSPSNLVYADEGNGLGYWLIGDDRNTKGNIGSNAVDLSYNDIAGMSDIGAVGIFSHAEGHSTLALYHASHAEGYLTSASHNSSHAEGSVTIASGFASHAEGSGVIASGTYSHAEGNSTRATGSASHAEGSDTYSTGGSGSHAEGYTTSATGFASHAEGNGCQAIGESSHAEGNYSRAYGLRSHAEGNITYSIGQYSHSEGYLSSAIGSASHAQGFGTIALGSNSHTEGNYTLASGSQSHAEGEYTTASGESSHAEGLSTEARSKASHAEGIGNVIPIDASIGITLPIPSA